MSILTIGPAYPGETTDLINADFLGALLHPSSTRTSTTFVTSPYAGDLITFTGSGFIYDGANRLIGGTITSISEVDAGLNVFNLTGLAIPVATTTTNEAFQLAAFGGADTMTGSADPEILASLGGNDSLSGLAGPDTLSGDGGNDTLAGGAGNDRLEGGADNDVLNTGGGGSGADTLDGGSGDDSLNAANFRVLVNGVLQPLPPAPRTFEGSVFDGGTGVDYLVVGSYTDFRGTISGIEGISFAAAGDIAVQPGVVIRFDTAVLEVTSAFTAALPAAATFRGVGEVWLNMTATTFNGSQYVFEAGSSVAFGVLGSSGNDSIVGTSNGDDLDGEEGSDTVTGGAGADVFEISEGHDRITDFVVGQDKFDLSDYGFDTFANLQPYLSQVGGNAVLTITYDGATHTVTFQGVSLASLNASAFIFATEAVDADATENADLLPGSSVADTISGLGGADTLAGFAGDDSLSGGEGGDSLVGGLGNDALSGGLGSDTLTGDLGADTLSGGVGADVFVALSDEDVISDFQAGAGGDVFSYEIFLSANTSWTPGTNPFASGHLRLAQSGADVEIAYDPDGDAGAASGGRLATLANSSVLNLTAANLGGYAPVAVSGSASPDAVAYTPTTFTPSGGAAPSFDGGGGVDTLSITIPGVLASAATVKPSDDGTQLLFDLNGDGVTDLKVSAVEDIFINLAKVEISGDLSRTGLAPNTIHYDGTANADVFDAGGLTSLESIRAKGLAGNDSLTGGNDDDTLEGGDGDDNLKGRGGPDSLNGGAGKDKLEGGDGADTLAGGAGVDTLTGGTGGDWFVIDRLSGLDRVVDFTGGDVLVFVGGRGAVTWTAKDIDRDGQTDDLTVKVAGPQGALLSVDLLNVANLQASDWLFT